MSKSRQSSSAAISLASPTKSHRQPPRLDLTKKSCEGVQLNKSVSSLGAPHHIAVRIPLETKTFLTNLRAKRKNNVTTTPTIVVVVIEVVLEFAVRLPHSYTDDAKEGE